MEDIGCSIIVSTYNRLFELKKCLEALLENNYGKFEIIVINDGSADGTKQYLEGIKNEKIKVIHNSENLGISRSRNKGIKAARFEIIAFTDDDCVADKNWLKNLIQEFHSEKTDFAIGQTFYIKPGYQGYFPERLVRNLKAQWPMSGNIAYKKSVLEEVGCFDHYFFLYNNEDAELGIRAAAKGFNCARALDAAVYHQAANWTVKSLLKSAKNASVWPILKKKYPKHYLYFNPPIKFKIFFDPKDYLFILTLPVLIPILLIRYLMHGKRDLKIFFAKWPVWLLLRRYYIYKEAIKNRSLII